MTPEYARRRSELMAYLASPDEAAALARKFHSTYEHLAPQFGYETREETRKFDPESKNGRLMIAVCTEVLKMLYA